MIMAIAEVLKFDSTADIFAWKYPNSELATWSQLIVNESQEAMLLKNGQVTDVFGPGRYVLSTDNIPVLQKLINIPFGRKSPFSAEVWFINKAFSLDIKWGTASPIQIQDPKYNLFVPVRAFGQFGIRIVDSKRFLIKLVGTMKFFNRNTLTDYFKGLYITRVKDSISSSLINAKISVFEINAHLNELSDALSRELRGELEEYGIELVSFFVNDINVPENDPAVKQLKAALAKRAEMDIIGYNYQQERTFDTLETAADNNGAAGAVMGSGIGLGVGFGIGGAIGDQAKSLRDNVNSQSDAKKCPSCGASVPGSVKFCPECGSDITGAAGKIVCSNCGSSYPKGTKFCPECGNRYNPCPKCGADVPDGAEKCPECGEGMPKACPGCGHMVSASQKFCPECGMSLVKKCSSCGAELANGVKFCPECGAKNE